MASLKLRKLPERTPVRVTIAVAPELHRLLADYATIYGDAYGREESVADLIPYMLESFLESDRDFARALRARKLSAR